MRFTRRNFFYFASVTCGAALFGGGYAAGSYRATLTTAHARITQKSSLIRTRFGDLEYAIEGHGDPFIMVHGTGGGFDQGLRFSGGLISSGFKVIAPSRFGYLRSSFPNDPSPQNQADCLVELMDFLKIDQVPIAGGSAGALTAAYFALRHPSRCSHLVLIVPAMNLTHQDPVEFTRFQRFLVGHLLSSDRWFWCAQAFAPEQLIGTLLATDPALLGTVDASERERAYLILNELMPISRRSQGIANDGRTSGTPSDIDFSKIKTPTLIVSAEDDRFGTARSAHIIKGRLPSARLVMFPTGGHIWLGREHELVSEIRDFVPGLAG
ncbi:alpha/beta fold hydrolase [Sulfitobacter sp. JB4-11]|uniref:alpha/beta fold hydrolase n=1 Tax=Sulfitobacter rhodophyticola TaxID=3238304 RepID=UPI003D815D2F